MKYLAFCLVVLIIGLYVFDYDRRPIKSYGPVICRDGTSREIRVMAQGDRIPGFIFQNYDVLLYKTRLDGLIVLEDSTHWISRDGMEWSFGFMIENPIERCIQG